MDPNYSFGFHRLGAAVLLRWTLDRPELAKHLAFMHEPRKVPVVPGR
jgi:hypothetical protein